MPTTELKIRRDVTGDITAMTPAEGELIYDITEKHVRAGDGSTAGGNIQGSAKDIQQQKFTYALVTGTDTLAATLAPALGSYTTGFKALVEIANNNTGAVTINFNALGAKTIKKNAGADDLAADDLVAGGLYPISYDGVNMQLLGAAVGLPAPDFESSEQTVTLDTLLNVAHSLGAKPTLVQVVLRCTTIDLNYATGDEISVASFGAIRATTDEGVCIFVDTTNVSIVQGAQIALLSKTSFNGNISVVTSWRWVVRAWA